MIRKLEQVPESVKALIEDQTATVALGKCAYEMSAFTYSDVRETSDYLGDMLAKVMTALTEESNIAAISSTEDLFVLFKNAIIDSGALRPFVEIILRGAEKGDLDSSTPAQLIHALSEFWRISFSGLPEGTRNMLTTFLSTFGSTVQRQLSALGASPSSPLPQGNQAAE